MNTILENTEICIRKYVTFSGRASRSEFWYFWLFQFIIGLVLNIVAYLVHFLAFLPLISALFFFLPNMSVAVRRLHDIDKSGWWYWIILVPLIGVILLLVWWCSRGDDEPNRFGPDPWAVT